MSEQETPFILCIRKEDTKWATITEGSTLTNCCECDEPVWISPASVQVMLERECKPLCLYCAVDKKPDRAVLPPSAEQLKEITRELIKQIENDENPTDRFKKRTGG